MDMFTLVTYGANIMNKVAKACGLVRNSNQAHHFPHVSKGKMRTLLLPPQQQVRRGSNTNLAPGFSRPNVQASLRVTAWGG